MTSYARHMTSFVIKILVDSDRHEFPMELFTNINHLCKQKQQSVKNAPLFKVRYMKEQGFHWLRYERETCLFDL